MESTGKPGALQVVQETREILEPFGYTFVERGFVNVKGKGELRTFYLQGKGDPQEPKPPAPVEQLAANPIPTESPAHPITSASSSTASSNSVRLNQNYTEAEAPNRAPANEATKDEAEPLLPSQNSTHSNINSNHVSVNEKHALLESAN